MNEELSKENNFKTIEKNNQLKKCPFFNESEIIAKYLIEKLISLVISTSFKKEIEKKISDFCFLDLINILNDMKDLEFIMHDNDDIIKKRTLLDYISKTPIKDRNKFKDFIILEEQDKKILNSSQIIKDYKLIKDLDPNFPVTPSIDVNPLLSIDKRHYSIEEKKVMEILKRNPDNKCGEFKLNNDINSYRKNTNSIDPFNISKNEQIEKIEKIESHRIDNFPMYNKISSNIILESKPFNFWGTIGQPSQPPIDRDASTKLKIDNKSFMNHWFNIPEDNEKPEIKTNKNIDNNNIKDKLIKPDNRIKKILKTRKLNAIKDKEPQIKNKRIIPIELPSFDLEPEKSNNIEETEDIKAMRKYVEIEINRRKNEVLKAQEEKEKKEKQKNTRSVKKTINGNVTVDIKGNIVYVRPIKYESLINEFKSMRSNPKEVAEIKDENYKAKNIKNVKVEKNVALDMFINNENENTGKKRLNASVNNYSKNEQTNKNKNNAKNEKNKEIAKTPDRNGMKFASGSNFDIMNLECGVNIIENNKKKTGGRDYYKKYGRCSFEIFQDQLTKTSSSFYQNNNSNIININVNDSNNNMKTDTNQNKSGLPSINKKRFNREKSDYDILNTAPNATNNILHLKTKNLKIALSNLDLINEDEIKELTKKNTEKTNILNNSKDIKPEKKDFGEMNIFNKALLKNKKWGEPNESFQYQYMTRKFPIKPDQKYLLREFSQNQLNHSPRKRLPPISSALKMYGDKINKIESGKNNGNKKLIKKLKDKNLSKDSLFDNKSKNYLSTTNIQYSNTEAGFSPIKKIEEI